MCFGAGAPKRAGTEYRDILRVNSKRRVQVAELAGRMSALALSRWGGGPLVRPFSDTSRIERHRLRVGKHVAAAEAHRPDLGRQIGWDRGGPGRHAVTREGSGAIATIRSMTAEFRASVASGAVAPSLETFVGYSATTSRYRGWAIARGASQLIERRQAPIVIAGKLEGVAGCLGVEPRLALRKLRLLPHSRARRILPYASLLAFSIPSGCGTATRERKLAASANGPTDSNECELLHGGILDRVRQLASEPSLVTVSSTSPGCTRGGLLHLGARLTQAGASR